MSSRNGRIRNAYVKAKCRGGNYSIREAQLWWFDHVMRRGEEDLG